MSKGFRGNKKSGRNSKDNSNRQSKSGSSAGPSTGGKKSRSQGGRDEQSAGGSRDDAKRSFSRGNTKKPIKNARSLSDVISGKSARGPEASGSSRPQSTRRDNVPSPAEAPEAPRSFGENLKRNISQKLQYIMNFQPRGATPVETPPAEPQPAKTPERLAQKQKAPIRKAAEQKPTSRAKEQPSSRGPAPADYRWPKDRKVAPKEEFDEKRNKTFTKSGKRADHMVSGVVKRHPDGYGFLIPDQADHVDVYIGRQSMLGVMTNDRVEAAVYRPKGGQKDERLSGEITKVTARANKTIVGKYLPVDQKYGVILDEGRGWGADLRIAAKDSMGAQEGQVVAVEVIQYPGTENEFTGKVTGIIGDIDNPINDVIRVVHQSSIPMEFSGQALAEARKYGGVVTDAEAKGREDLTGLSLITIDGATARDFDDAVHTEQTDRGFHLTVAIADVSHYVKPGTPLDQEAYERGTSTYFPNFVVPMLPEELSNELCSLKPKVKRLCFVCEMHINFNGDVMDYRFFEGVMESKARVTYGEAQEVLDAHAAREAGGPQKGRSPTLEKLKHVEDNIRLSADLAKILMAKRFRDGSLDLEIPETQVVVDSTGESVDVIKSERLFAHRLIEELMLVTNICTARFMEDKKIPGIFRVHESPDPDNLESLQRYLWNFGGSKSVIGTNLQKKLSQALQSMEGRLEAQILNILTLRTMKQAHYSKDNVGHFGLGFSQYSHFTSPIRRYPDLIAHRLIKSQLYPKYRSMLMDEDELASATVFLSACEQRSTKAERKVVSIKKARFMKKFVGEEFEGVISSVAKFGVFVLLRQFDVDGLVKVEKLGNDRFEFDQENLRLIGSRSGFRYTIGDVIRVQVTGADAEAGKIDFDLAEDLHHRDLSSGPDSESEDELDQRGGKPRDSKRGAFNKSVKGRKSAKQQNGSEQKGARKKAKKAGSKKSVNVQERGKAKNDSRGVRKERVSKRRGKN